MRDHYSIYEAKTQLSALVRHVRDGGRVTITVHGEPAAELRPIERRPEPETVEDRLADLERRGMLQRASVSPSTPGAVRVGKRAPGALARFLRDRE
jgi:prevent-host-death family protein